MDRRRFLVLGVTTLLASCVPSYEQVKPLLERYQQEHTENLKHHIKGILENQVEFTTKSKFKHPYSGKEIENNMEGPGTIVNYKGKDYIFTVDHLTSTQEIRMNMGPFGIQTFPVTDIIKDESKLGVNVLERIVSKKERDIAVFLLPKGYKRPKYHVRLGNSDEMKVLDEVYLLGEPGGIRRNIREGIVANKIGVSRFPDGTEEEGFNISTGGYFGDSGTPVINSDGEIIGFLSQFHFNSISSFIRPINWYKEEIGKLKNGRRKNN